MDCPDRNWSYDYLYGCYLWSELKMENLFFTSITVEILLGAKYIDAVQDAIDIAKEADCDVIIYCGGRTIPVAPWSIAENVVEKYFS